MPETIRPGLLAATAALTAVLLTAPATPLAAQEGSGEGLPTLTPDDYDRWERLRGSELSPRGEWLAVSIDRVDDDDELRVRRTEGDSTVTIPFGERPAFSEDGRWLAYAIGISEDSADALREKDRPVRDDLGLLDLRTGDTTRVEEVAGFAFSDDGGWLAMRRYPPEGREDGNDAPRGADLVVRRLADGTDTNFGNVAEFAWQDDGPLLALVIDAAGDAGNGVQLYDPPTGVLRTLQSRAAPFTGLAWRPDAADLAVLRRRGDEAYEDSTHVIVAWRGLDEGDPGDPGETRAEAFDPADVDAFPAEHRVVDFRSLRWSEDGGTLFFGIKEREKAEEEEEAAEEGEEEPAEETGEETGEEEAAGGDDEDEGEEPADVEIWHARDVDIVPRQKVTEERDRRENHLAAWHLDDDRFVRLGDDVTEDVDVVEGTGVALGFDETPYETVRMFGPRYRDVHVIDVTTGEKEKALERVQYFFGASPEGRYLLFLRDDHYRSYDIDSGETVNLTGELPTSFVDLDDDHTVDQKPPFGTGGWLRDGRAVLLYDEYDIWSVAPDGADARRLTRGAADTVRHRRVELRTAEERAEVPGIDPDAPLYLSLYDEWEEAHGYARMDDIDAEPERLVWREKGIGGLERADDAEVYAYGIEDFDDSPDVFVGGPRLDDARQVTRTNAFQSEYAWGDSELVEYENARGERLQGALFYPAGHEPGRTYPMVVYIYETRSPSVRSYDAPAERDAYDTTIWTQNGYFVFQPDIVYRDRNPGVSAVEAIVPAVERVVESGMVDRDRIGLTGHSWGGYQTTFTVTQTDLFAAAVAGAPLTNLVSMYNSIYWRTGGTDARIFEISQGRMEVPPWEDMEAYTRNSPLHNIEAMETPLMVGFGTDDGAVEFNQGVEFYNAARRARKELVMVVYNGENHGFSREEPSRRDYHRRLMAWFGHHLKGEEAPEWINEGVPFLEQQEALEEKK